MKRIDMCYFQVEDLRPVMIYHFHFPLAGGLWKQLSHRTLTIWALGLGRVEPHCHGKWRMSEIDFCDVHSLRFWGLLLTTAHPNEA